MSEKAPMNLNLEQQIADPNAAGIYESAKELSEGYDAAIDSLPASGQDNAITDLDTGSKVYHHGADNHLVHETPDGYKSLVASRLGRAVGLDRLLIDQSEITGKYITETHYSDEMKKAHAGDMDYGELNTDSAVTIVRRAANGQVYRAKIGGERGQNMADKLNRRMARKLAGPALSQTVNKEIA